MSPPPATCSCSCHPHGNMRHPATGCCPCCPALKVPDSAVADIFHIAGRGQSYVLRISEPLLMEGDHIVLTDRTGGGPTYVVTGIERFMTLPPIQVMSGCQSVLLRAVPAEPGIPGDRLAPPEVVEAYERMPRPESFAQEVWDGMGTTEQAHAMEAAHDLRSGQELLTQPEALPAGHPTHPHGRPEEWRDDGKCIWKSCGVWRAGTAPTLDAHLSTIRAGYCPIHGVRLTERGGCPEVRREEPEVARGEHRALTDDVDGHIVTRTCSCGESFTTTSEALPVVWADHINRSTNRPTLRQRVAYAIRDAHTNRPYRECNEEYMTPSGDATEWWFTAADAVMEVLDDE